ncbi:MAG: hemerythrin domain-containing protein [Actinomycetota bacterium]|nr:hemerythrin domain-containing protein [Actinomycetota bacterium]
MNAIELLKQDHREMEKLLEKLDSTTDRGVKAREELFTRIKKEMTAHEAIEEEIFYPALKKHAEAKEIVLEGFEEHHVVDLLLGELEQVSYDDETWGAKASVMKENVEHHIEEEEDDMFDKAEKLLDDDELESLGERMQNRKKEALGS